MNQQNQDQNQNSNKKKYDWREDHCWKEEIVTAAAIYIDDKRKHSHQPSNIETGFVIVGHRHHNCILLSDLLQEKYNEKIGESVQGFITSKYRFLNRKEAAELAFKRGQTSWNKELLFSEDLY